MSFNNESLMPDHPQSLRLAPSSSLRDPEGSPIAFFELVSRPPIESTGLSRHDQRACPFCGR